MVLLRGAISVGTNVDELSQKPNATRPPMKAKKLTNLIEHYN